MSDLTYFVNKNGSVFVFNHKTEQRLSLIPLLEAQGCHYYLDEESACKKAARNKSLNKTKEELLGTANFAFDYQEKRIKTYLKGFTGNRSFPFYITLNEATILGFNDQESYIQFLSNYQSNEEIDLLYQQFTLSVLKK